MRTLDLEHQQHRRNPNSRLSLTVTPAFPILISSDIVVLKENSTIPVTRSRSSSIPVAEELSPENQSKIFPIESLLWDRLSLISTTESVTSGSESGGANDDKCSSSQPTLHQEKICLQLSDWLIQRGEQRRWMELTENIDFNEEVDPSLYLCPHADLLGGAISPIQQQQECFASTLMLDGYQREEGNSVFYAKSCSQQPSTSTATPRVYEVAMTTDDESRQSSTPASSADQSPIMQKSSQQTRRRQCVASREGTEEIGEVNGQTKESSSNNGQIPELIAAMATNGYGRKCQDTLKLADLMRTFDETTASGNLQMFTNRNWRSPRKKFIFELQKPNDFLTQLALQKHRCAGCGTKMDRAQAKRAQFCHYFSKLFCPCCHQGSKARIPSRILHEWNFKEFPVSDVAKKFLIDNEDQPVFNVSLVNAGLYKKARNLRKFRKMRLKIAHMWPFVQKCQLAEQLMTENGILRTMFTSVPGRFLSLESIDIYSLLDFERIANRNLLETLEPLVTMGAAHIEGCMYCRQHGFFCQLCMDSADLLFPFQLDRCYRCEGCGSLSHLKCFKSAAAKLPASNNGSGGTEDGQRCQMPACNKCERIRRKKHRLQQLGTTSDHSSEYASE